MFKPQTTLACTALAACLATFTPDASYGYGFQGFYGGCGIGGLYRSLDYPTERRVPYFAARPPVYYSFPVPRTYGYSPFAYSPLTHTPEWIGPAQGEVIENPHVEGASRTIKKQQAESRDKMASSTMEIKVSAPKPITVINPFVEQSNDDREYH